MGSLTSSFGNGFSPGSRQMGVSYTVDMTNLPTLPERLDEYFREALVFHIKDAADTVIGGLGSRECESTVFSRPALKIQKCPFSVPTNTLPSATRAFA